MTGCLVESSDPLPIKERSTDTLRQIIGNEFLQYRVRGQVTLPTGGAPVFVNGTMRIEYSSTSIQSPEVPLGIDQPIPVIREETTLSFDETSSTFTSVRFLDQDPDGTIHVVAYPGSEIYWTAEEGANLSVISPIKLIDSPVPSSGENPISFEVRSGCNTGGSCTESLVRIQELQKFQGDSVIATIAGRFNVLRVDSANGLLTPLIPGDILEIFDIRAACDPKSSSFFGTQLIFPEVGLVYFENSCTSNQAGVGHSFSAELESTSIPIP